MVCVQIPTLHLMLSVEMYLHKRLERLTYLTLCTLRNFTLLLSYENSPLGSGFTLDTNSDLLTESPVLVKTDCPSLTSSTYRLFSVYTPTPHFLFCSTAVHAGAAQQ